MKALIASVAAVAALSVALPAAAQSWGRFAPAPGSQTAARMAQRIDVGVRNGSLTPREANRLHERLRRAQELEWRYGRDGYISPKEARKLDRRYGELQGRLRHERRDNDRAYPRYGYGYYR